MLRICYKCYKVVTNISDNVINKKQKYDNRYNTNICSSMFCSDSQIWFYRTFVLLLILRKNVDLPWFYGMGGWKKLIAWTGNAAEPIADSSTDFLQNFNLSISLKIPTKSSKIQNFTLQTTYRTPYRQIPLKSSISATSKPKNQTSISQKSTHKSKIFLIYMHFYR